jgi:signal transduction histidine kinase
MEATKKQLLYKTYQLFFDSMMDMNFPLEQVNSFVPADVMGYGTTVDEKILGYDEFINLVKLQRTQAEGELFWERKPVFEKISQDGNTALFVEEMTVTMKMATGDNIIPLRITSVLSFDSGKWELVHWHGSQAIEITDDTWHKEEWKQKNEALQKLVDEKTADLEAKNRELAIEAALERVRAVAMGMQEAADLLKICQQLFHELESLGFTELRNAMVNVNDDSASLLNNYDYSGKAGGEVTVIPYNSHPATRNIVNKLKKSSKAFGQFALTGKKLEEWRDYRKGLGEKDDPKLESTKKLSYYFYSTGTGSIGISTYKPIAKDQVALLERFRNVFELAYRRYTDIQQAEDQAREAKIEVALEKVRARTMAMQHSSELPEAANLLFLEVQALGIPAWSCGYNILAEDKKSVMCWMSSEGQIQSGFHLPFTNTGEKSFPQWEKAIKDKVPFLVQELGGKDIEDHYDYMRTLPGLEPILKELDEAGLALPTYQINHLSFFNGGFLLFITYEKVPEAHDLFTRFTKVFEQTYIRFLDLQKAEAQAIEAEIELALERVRARSMAMQTSEELKDVVKEIFDQMALLNINAEHAGIVVDFKPRQDWHFWVAENQNIPAKITVPYLDLIWDRQFTAAKNKGKDFFTTELNFAKKNNFYKKLLPHIPGLTKKSRDFYLSCPGLAISTVIQKDIGLYIENFSGEPYSEKENDTLRRFGMVFQQSYTRFLDLQKAEAQAREAKIEAALDRVRAASMAMHKTQNIADVVVIFFEQLKLLEVKFVQSWINVIRPDEGIIDLWLSPLEGVYEEPAFFKIPLALFENTTVKSWKAGEPFSYVSFNSKEELDHLFKACDEAAGSKYFSHLQKKLKLERLEFLDANYKFGAVSKSGIDKASPEEEAILHRFAKVFEQTYTRFLDLQKAEAQAREAQIEAALERIRAASLAMHSSVELKNVINVIFAQFKELKIDLDSCYIDIFQEDNWDFNLWVGTSNDAYPEKLLLPYGRHSLFKRSKQARLNGESFITLKFNRESKNRLVTYLAKSYKITKQRQKEMLRGDSLAMSIALNKHASLALYNYRGISYTEEENNILKRVSKVFEQTYTRFLDLQKAEAQAREAQIEAALERVRAASMAMHASEELQEVIRVLYDQIKSLEVPINSAQLGFPRPDNKDFFLRIASEDEVYLDEIRIPYTKHPIFDRFWKSYDQTEKVSFSDSFTKKEKDTFFNYCFANSKLGLISKQQKKVVLNAPGLEWSSAIIGQISLSITNYQLIPYSEKDNALVLRFGEVFYQSYIRFLDLQKAEEQAREAQIEAALERVRAKSMAMHTSENLLDTISEFFTQLKLLDVVPVRCGVAQMLTTPPSWIWTATHATIQGDSVEASGLLTNLGHPVLQSIYDNWIDQENYFPILKGKDLRDYYKVLRKELTIPEFTRGEVHYGHYFNFKEGNIFAWTTEPLRSEEVTIFERFSLVLSLTYRRYLDLQKAEAQAREAQIEAALERIRAASLAMHSSVELKNVINVIFTQFKELKIDLDSCFIDIFQEDNWDFNLWVGTSNDAYPEKLLLPYGRHSLFKRSKQARLNGESFITLKFNRESKNRLVTYLAKSYKITKQRQKEMLRGGSLAMSIALNMHASLALYNYRGISYTEEENNILKRVSKVFEQTYTRFLDLQKAEAQAREAQVETALERVRSRTMAMHSSDELAETALVLFQQLKELGIAHERTNIGIVDEANRKIHFWLTTQKGTLVDKTFSPDIDESETLKTFYAGYKEKKKSIVVIQKGAELKKWISFITGKQIPYNPPTRNERRVQTVGYSSQGMLIATSTDPLDDESITIIERFAAVFDQTYTRFLDLQKAEAQAREAQIEVALERVRARASAMHKAEELKEVAFELRTQMGLLGQEELEVCGIHLYEVDENYFESWGAMRVEGSNRIIQGQSRFPKTGVAIIEEMLSNYNSGKGDYVLVNEGEKAAGFFKMMKKHAPDMYKNFVSILNKVPAQERIAYWSLADFKGGAILMVTYQPPEDDSLNLLRRVANVFDLAYRRFLDLKKAENQAREAQIETALERIRSQAMAMNQSADLLDIVVTMRTEFVNLGHEAGYFWYMRWQQEIYEKAMTSGDGTRIGMVMQLPRSIHGEIPLLDKWEKSNRPTVVYPMDADTAIAYVDKMVSLGDFKQVDPKAPTPDDIRHIGGITFIMARTTYGEIGYSLNGVVQEPPPEALALLERFAGVFDLAYRRFEDLQVAEAQAKAATKQASLDRVRAEIASMRSPKDLERITPLVWKELTTLGVPFFRCGIFIIKEEEEMVHAYLSTPTGESLAALHIRFEETAIGLIGPSIDNWRKQEVYTEEWDQKRFMENMQLFMKRGDVKSSKKYQAGDKPPEKLVLHLVPFKQGMLYVGNSGTLIQEHIELMQDLAKAFSIAYSRYEDFVQLEDAKEKVENTLTDLKSAQNQLVHAEKMASLGELTAGIAHEIQNPLNFVNNFSELNKELIEELREELAKGDLEEVEAITQDIINNEEKISHHGKRAEGIVKGMLQHSRSNTGEKELTDINVLADEYLRLSYHGLRAKDKSFNADFELKLDDNLPKVNVVAQDIGRVLLNLINNAFYACTEQLERASADRSVSTYQPLVSISTLWNDKKVQITVSDNGSGIPEQVRDKIFQPFFTTKATGEGTGLGLSLSYDIITKGHGGSIEVESIEGNGTIFKVSLPVAVSKH